MGIVPLHYQQGHGEQHGLVAKVDVTEVLAHLRIILQKQNIEEVGKTFLSAQVSGARFRECPWTPLGSFPRQPYVNS
jgi:hypothetical protein